MGVRAKLFWEEPSEHLHHMAAAAFWRVCVIAIGAGMATWILGLLLDRWILIPLFCSETATSVAMCIHSTAWSGHIATVLIGVMTVPILTVAGIKRPLLVVAAALASLWGVAAWTAGSWVTMLLLTMLAYGVVYAALVWLNRVRDNVTAVLLLVAFVVVVRVVLLV